MTPYIIGFLFIALIALLVIGGDKKLRLKIKSKNGGNFIAEKKDDSRGNAFLDWFYYDENGKSSEDEKVKMMIFEAFGDEDWYGDYEFYTKATSEVKENDRTSEVV